MPVLIDQPTKIQHKQQKSLKFYISDHSDKYKLRIE